MISSHQINRSPGTVGSVYGFARQCAKWLMITGVTPYFSLPSLHLSLHYDQKAHWSRHHPEKKSEVKQISHDLSHRGLSWMCHSVVKCGFVHLSLSNLCHRRHCCNMVMFNAATASLICIEFCTYLKNLIGRKKWIPYATSNAIFMRTNWQGIGHFDLMAWRKTSRI